MDDRDGPNLDAGPRLGGTLIWAIRTAAVTAFVGLAATQYLARVSAPSTAEAVSQVARAGTSRLAPDPETTGSISEGARFVRLDPCAVTPGLRLLKR